MCVRNMVVSTHLLLLVSYLLSLEVVTVDVDSDNVKGVAPSHETAEKLHSDCQPVI